MSFLRKVQKVEAGNTDARNLAYRLILDAEKLSSLFSPKKMGAYSLLPREIKKKSRIKLDENLMTILLPLPDSSAGDILDKDSMAVIKKNQEIALKEYEKLFNGLLKKFNSLGWVIEESSISNVGGVAELFFVSDSFMGDTVQRI